MQTLLRAIANKASVDKQHRFRNLFGELSVDYLTQCWKTINKKAAAGIDRVTARQYGKNLAENLSNLVETIKDQSYRSKWIRRKYIPKANGKLRPLGIPATQDKILQAGASELVQAIYEYGDFLPCSYGYRPARSTLDAVKDLTRTLQAGQFHHLVEADIQGYFDNIDHDLLLAMLAQRINDRAFTELIRRWLKAPILEPDGRKVVPVKGSPQGGIISPVLANIYLHVALDKWFHEEFQPRCKGAARMWRYADDFIAAFEVESDAQAFYLALTERLREYKLELAADKTRCIRFSRRKIKDSESFEFLGFQMRWGKSLKGFPCIKKRTSPKKYKAALKKASEQIKKYCSLPKREMMKRVSSMLRGHYNYYGVRGNYEKIADFRYQVTRRVFEMMNRRSQRKSYSWETFKEMLSYYRLPSPRIVHSF